MSSPRFSKLLASLVVTLAAAAMTPAAMATHFRGGNTAWTASDNGNGTTTVTYTVTSYWRKTAFFSLSQVLTGANTFNHGSTPGVSSLSIASVIFDSPAEDIVGGVQVFSKTYTTGSSVNETVLNSCCRLSSLGSDQNDDPFMLTSTLNNIGATSSGPVLGVNSPILTLAVGGVQNFQLLGSSTWSTPTGAQSGLSPTNPFIGANVLSMSGSGLLSWDTTGGVVGQLYAFQAYATDSNGNTNPFDFLIRLCAPGTPGCGQFIPTVPEPTTLALLGLGLFGLGFIGRRKKLR